ncbi:MAG: tetratricopeptide repeat protein, partial [Comamonas sp.]
SSTVPPALAAGAGIEAGPLYDAVQAYARATRWVPADGRLQQDHARLLMRQGRVPDAIAALRVSLAAAPDRASSWWLLAYLEDAAGTDGAALAPLLRLSQATGPRDASAMLARAAVSLRHWSDMPDDLRAATRTELRYLHDVPWMRARFLRLYVEQDFVGRILIREAVLTRPADAAGFNRAVRAAADLSAAAP